LFCFSYHRYDYYKQQVIRCNTRGGTFTFFSLSERKEKESKRKALKSEKKVKENNRELKKVKRNLRKVFNNEMN
jgi:hypothetical protein